MAENGTSPGGESEKQSGVTVTSPRALEPGLRQHLSRVWADFVCSDRGGAATIRPMCRGAFEESLASGGSVYALKGLRCTEVPAGNAEDIREATSPIRQDGRLVFLRRMGGAAKGPIEKWGAFTAPGFLGSGGSTLKNRGPIRARSSVRVPRASLGRGLVRRFSRVGGRFTSPAPN